MWVFPALAIGHVNEMFLLQKYYDYYYYDHY